MAIDATKKGNIRLFWLETKPTAPKAEPVTVTPEPAAPADTRVADSRLAPVTAPAPEAKKGFWQKFDSKWNKFLLGMRAAVGVINPWTRPTPVDHGPVVANNGDNPLGIPLKAGDATLSFSFANLHGKISKVEPNLIEVASQKGATARLERTGPHAGLLVIGDKTYPVEIRKHADGTTVVREPVRNVEAHIARDAKGRLTIEARHPLMASSATIKTP